MSVNGTANSATYVAMEKITELHIGDAVKLTCGGPLMTVSKIEERESHEPLNRPAKTLVDLAYFDGHGKLQVVVGCDIKALRLVHRVVRKDVL